MGAQLGGGGPSPFVRHTDFILEFFREGGGSMEMAVDGSITPVEFEWENEEPIRHAVVSRLLWDILDGSPTTIKFGGIIGGLANGVLIDLRDAAGTLVMDFTDGDPIKQNHQFARMVGTDWALTIGAGVDAVNVRWSLFKTGKQLLVPPGFKLRVTVRDDLTTLDSMSVSLQGYRIGGGV